MNNYKYEKDHYILDREGEIDKKALVEILNLAWITVPAQFPGKIDPDQYADSIEPNLDRVNKGKIPPLVVTDLNLLDYKHWGHFRLVKLPKEYLNNKP